MATILVVDDSAFDRALAGGLLAHRPGFQVVYADCGQAALEQAASERPDLVVTDLLMPQMDGLELVRRLRRDFPRIPVVLMTALEDEVIAVRALEQGAASFVPKKQLSERLVETVERVLERAYPDREWSRILGRITKLECSFSLENDPALIAPLIDYIQHTLGAMGVCDVHEQVRIGIALEEALLNALYHGNLQISAAELAEARADHRGGKMTRLVEQRHGLPQCRQRKIALDVSISSSGARFVVRDEGPGFDHTAVQRVDLAESIGQGRSRGLLLMQTLMDEVAFNQVGNEVTLVKLPERLSATVRRIIDERRTSPKGGSDLLGELLNRLRAEEAGAS